jgi:hypothetical protein
MSALLEFLLKIAEYIITRITFKTTQDSIERIITIYDSMKALLHEALIHRCVIFKVENGGGKIKPGVNIYMSAIHEDYDPRFVKAIKFDIQRIQLDKQYLNVLANLLANGYADIFTDKLEDGSILKTKYTDAGIKYAEYYL